MIYSYAITNIHGPESSPTILAGTLRDWGVTVAYTTSPPASTHTRPALPSLVAKVERAILGQHSVRVTITGSHGSQLVETITSDIGTSSASESLSDNGAEATIRVTPRSAYFMGNTAGLTNLIGLTKATARRIGKDWVQVKKGSIEYSDFAAEDTLAALPASVLPDASQSISLRSSTPAGKRARVLTWTANVAQSGTEETLREALVLSAGAIPLPVTEESQVNGYKQVVTFANWGESIAVLPPSSRVLQYNSIERE
jgi:hypothetical protein